MILDAQHRSSIYQKLVPLLGEDDTNALMSLFPSSEVDQIATRGDLHATEAHLRAELASTRTELEGDIAELRTELEGDIAGLRTELKGDIAGLRTELKGDIAELKAELEGDIAGLKAEISGVRNDSGENLAVLRAEMADRFRQQTAWTAGAMFAGLGLAAAIAQTLG